MNGNTITKSSLVKPMTSVMAKGWIMCFHRRQTALGSREVAE